MLQYFKSPTYRCIYDAFDTAGIFSDDFANFSLKKVAPLWANNPKATSYTFKVLQRLTPSTCRLFKSLLLLHNMLQNETIVCLQCQINKLFDAIMQQLEERCDKLMCEANKSNELKTCSDRNIDSKYKQASSMKMYILQNLIKPYIQYIQKTKMLAELLYLTDSRVKKLTFEEAWVLINHLKKMLDFSASLEYLGRYFKKGDYFEGCVSLMVGIDVDINFCYEFLRVTIRDKTSEIGQTIDQLLKPSTEMQETMLLVSEIALINDRLNSFYHGKYYQAELQSRIQKQIAVINHAQYESIFHDNYQIKIRQKKQEARIERSQLKDLSKTANYESLLRTARQYNQLRKSAQNVRNSRTNTPEQKPAMVTAISKDDKESSA